MPPWSSCWPPRIPEPVLSSGGCRTGWRQARTYPPPLCSPTRWRAAWGLAQQLAIQLHPLTSGLEVIRVALRLGRASAYDAAYIALARERGADLWTLDGPLARTATGVGYPVHLVE
jgi:predicted nucleic acid-binding protein